MSYLWSDKLATLAVTLILLGTANWEGTNGKTLSVACKNDSECLTHQYCHSIHGICINTTHAGFGPSQTSSSPRTCNSKEYWHAQFRKCLPKLIPLPPLPLPRRKLRDNCTTDADCTGNKYCHFKFKMCLDVLKIPTIASSKRPLNPCTSNANCSQAEFCHDIFGGCVIKPPGYDLVKRRIASFGCQLDADCQWGQYCHNMSHICLHARNSSAYLANSKQPCTSHDDCKITEFCGLLFGRRGSTSVAARHRRKCSASNCSHRSGVCVPHESCARGGMCSNNFYCLRKLAICMDYKQKGDACVLQSNANAEFVSPCATGLECHVITRVKAKVRKVKPKRRVRRLIRKLLIPQIILKMPATQLWLSSQPALGVCRAQA